MKNQILKSLFIIGFNLFACFTLLSQSNVDLKAKIEKLNKEMGDAMVAGNSDKSLSYYTDDAISMPANEKMQEGKDAIKKANEEMKKSGSKVTAFQSTTKKIMVADKTITEIGNYKISFTMPGKSDPMNDAGKYVTIWEKQSDGSLKVKLEIWNSDMNPMNMDKM